MLPNAPQCEQKVNFSFRDSQRFAHAYILSIRRILASMTKSCVKAILSKACVPVNCYHSNTIVLSDDIELSRSS